MVGWRFRLIFNSFFTLLCGSTVGVLIRLLIIKKYNIKVGYTINNISFINIFSCFLAGILISLSINQESILYIFIISFLACFSTFSSFIFYLFTLLIEGKYLRFFKHYVEVIMDSIIFFCLGLYCVQYIFNWNYQNYF